MFLGKIIGEQRLAQDLKVEINNSFELNYFSYRRTQMGSQEAYYLNIHKVLYDRKIRMIDEEDVLMNVNFSDWYCMFKTYVHFEDEEIEELQKEKEIWMSFSEWMNLLICSKDAENKEGWQQIKNRVWRLYLNIISSKHEDKMRLLKIIKKHSENCADGAIVGLERSEIMARFMHCGEALLINLLVLEFKKCVIKSEFVPQSKESNESYLYYCLLLNDVMMLKMKNETMLFHQIVKKYSFDEICKRIFGRMTIEDLVGFISQHKLYRKVKFDENDIDRIKYLENISSIKNEIEKLDPKKDEKEIILLFGQLERITDKFYEVKALAILVRRGFITSNSNYKDPSFFPSIKMHLKSQKNVNTDEMENQSGLEILNNIIFIGIYSVLMVVCMLFCTLIKSLYFY